MLCGCQVLVSQYQVCVVKRNYKKKQNAKWINMNVRASGEHIKQVLMLPVFWKELVKRNKGQEQTINSLWYLWSFFYFLFSSSSLDGL